MKIHIKRTDRLAGLADDPQHHVPGLLSDNTFYDWAAAFKFLRDHGVPLTGAVEEELQCYQHSSFFRNEFIGSGGMAYACHVRYEIVVANSSEEAA